MRRKALLVLLWRNRYGGCVLLEGPGFRVEAAVWLPLGLRLWVFQRGVIQGAEWVGKVVVSGEEIDGLPGGCPLAGWSGQVSQT